MRDMHFPWPARAEAKIDQSAPGMSRGTWLDSAAPCFRQATVVLVARSTVLTLASWQLVISIIWSFWDQILVNLHKLIRRKLWLSALTNLRIA